MQLIFETEATINIVDKMTSVDAMPIAESKPDSPPDVIKVSKCNSMDINNIDIDTVKAEENGTSKEQNGDADIAMMTELDEANVNVVHKDKENDISAHNGNGDIAKSKIAAVEPVSTKDIEIVQIVSDSEKVMHVEDELPDLPDNLETSDNVINPEIETNGIVLNSLITDVKKQDDVEDTNNEKGIKIIQSDLDIKENISFKQVIPNKNIHVVINDTEVAAIKNGDVGKDNIDNLTSVISSTEALPDDKKVIMNNQEKGTNITDSATKEIFMPKNTIEDEIKSTDLTGMDFDVNNHTPDEDNVTTLDNNFQERTNSNDETQENKMKSHDQEGEINSADEAQQNKIEITAQKEVIKFSDAVLVHKVEATDLEAENKCTVETQENETKVTCNKEGNSSNEAQENKMEITDQEDENKSTDEPLEEPLAANAYVGDIKLTDEAKVNPMEVTDHEGIKSSDESQENYIKVTAHEDQIKSADEVVENKIKATDLNDGVKFTNDAPEIRMESTHYDAEIKILGASKENNPEENTKSSDMTQERKPINSDQLNLSEQKHRSDSLESVRKMVDDNNEESVINVNSDNVTSKACDESILNCSKQENSDIELKDHSVEKSCLNKISDNPNNVNSQTHLKNMNTCDCDTKDDNEIKDISVSKAILPKPDKDFKATALEAMDVDSTEDLTTDDVAVTNISVFPTETALDKPISEDIISVDSGKTVNLDSDRKSSPVTVIDCDEIQDTHSEQSNAHQNKTENDQAEQNPNVLSNSRKTNSVCGLSNTLDILSDDDDCVEECKDKIPEKNESTANKNKCINLDEDDDVMLIDDPPIDKEPEVPKIEDYMQSQENESVNQKKEDDKHKNDQMNTINLDNDSEPETSKASTNDVCKDKVAADVPLYEDSKIKAPEIGEKLEESVVSPKEIQRPIIPENFLKAFRKNVVDMNRDELEEFCLMKIVEGIIDQTNLSEIKTKLKTMSSYVEEWKKKVMALTKQNRDLQIVLKTVQDEQKKRSDHQVVPLKITRSVGMQVYMAEVTDRNASKRKPPPATPVARTNNRNTPTRPSGKPNPAIMPIPVPRLVPAANNSPMKIRPPQQVQNATVTSNSPKQFTQNGMKTPSPAQKTEKRPFSSVQSVTVDLTDDEPPAKQPATGRNSAQQAPVRLVAQQQLMKPRAQNPMGNNAARKVFIPINPQNNIRPGQTITLKSIPPNARIRGPGPQNHAVPVRVQSNVIRGPRPNSNVRHPAPLPEVAKQQQPPNWKALPPAPDLKISKVENGIVISWKIEGYQEDSYEEIASYQLYAYQETSSPPSTLLWKKIGDVKALPLPMACTLTQFMAGYKYYFAVRAVDIRSRIGTFSLPGSILLLNK